MNKIPEQSVPDLISQNGNQVPDSEPLRLYTKSKFALAAHLRSLREIFNRRGNETRAEQCEELMAKLAEDRFTLAVLGQFKRGKSSLMNAIIGHELLPVGVLPLTSAITVLRFGPKQRLLIRRENNNLPFQEEFPVNKLAEFVTENENPGNCKQIKAATIETPLPFLRRGLEFVDTPGIGSTIEANTTTTLKFLPECDAALFVTSVESPLSRAELEFLERIRQHVHKIFFIVNKADLLASFERQEVLDFIRGAISKQMGVDNIKIFPVSARLGLESKVDGNWMVGLESGLSDLENELARFLSTEKASLFLAAIIRRALWLLEQESFEAGLVTHANELPEKVLAERMGTVTVRWENQKTERRQIFDRLRQRVLSLVQVTLMPELLSFIHSEIDKFAINTEQMLATLTWCPLRSAWEKAEQITLNQTRKNVLDWLSEHAERFGFASDETVRAEWQRIQMNVANLPAVAADIFGLHHAVKHDGEILSPWHLNVKFEKPFVFNLPRHVRLSAWPAMLPVFLTRKWLTEHLKIERKHMENKCCEAIVVYAADNVLKALDDLANEVEKRASEISLRVMASLRGGISSAADSATNTEAVDTIRRQLVALGAEISPTQPDLTNKFGDANGVTLLSPHSSASSINGLKLASINFVADLKTRYCPVCNYLSHVAFHFLANFQWDLIQNRVTQQAFARELGFCPLHTWQLEAISSPRGASIGFVELAEHISKILAEKGDASANGQSVRELALKPKHCRVCRLLHEAELNYLKQLTEFIERSNGHTAYVGSQGVCLRHLDFWLPLLNNESVQFVLRHASVCFEEMAEDMQSFSLKTEAFRRSLNNSDEDDAYLRAIVHVAGTRSNCMPMSKEAEI